jgi:hypothetical protein
MPAQQKNAILVVNTKSRRGGNGFRQAVGALTDGGINPDADDRAERPVKAEGAGVGIGFKGRSG